MTPTPANPLVAAQDARIDRDGFPLCDQLSFAADGERIVLAGAGALAIADAIMLDAVVAHGTLFIDGHNVGRREHVGTIGLAPVDPPLPPGMSVDGYLTLSFRTSGLGRRAAQTAASSALADLGIQDLAPRRTDSLAIPERRAVILAGALSPVSRCVVAQTPLAGIEGPAADYVLSVLGHMSKRRRVLVTASRFDAAGTERDLIIGASHVVLIDRHQVIWRGTSAELVQAGAMAAICTRSASPEFLLTLAERGFVVHGAPPRFSLSLPAGATLTDVLAIAQATATQVVEMVPLAGHPSSGPSRPETASEISPAQDPNP